MATGFSDDIDRAIAELPRPVAEFFRRLRANPDYSCKALKMQMTVHFRGRKVGGLNRKTSQWYVSKVFVRENGSPDTMRSHGFRHVEHNEAHTYWVAEGHGSMSAFKNAVENMTGVAV